MDATEPPRLITFTFEEALRRAPTAEIRQADGRSAGWITFDCPPHGVLTDHQSDGHEDLPRTRPGTIVSTPGMTTATSSGTTGPSGNFDSGSFIHLLDVPLVGSESRIMIEGLTIEQAIHRQPPVIYVEPLPCRASRPLVNRPRPYYPTRKM